MTGLSESDELGFIMDESSVSRHDFNHPERGGLSVLHRYDPASHQRTVMRVYHNGFPAVLAFQHLGGDRWLTASLGQINLIVLRQVNGS